MTDTRKGWSQAGADMRASWKKGLAFVALAIVVGYLLGQVIDALLV